jgi:hypothetical protein
MPGFLFSLTIAKVIGSPLSFSRCNRNLGGTFAIVSDQPFCMLICLVGVNWRYKLEDRGPETLVLLPGHLSVTDRLLVI